MKIELSELAFVIVATTLLFVFIIFLIIAFFLVYQSKKKQRDIEDQLRVQQFEKELFNAQNEIREETMKFISQELHDNIAQSLVVLNLGMNTLDFKGENLTFLKDSLQHTIEQVRLLSKTLNTENLLEGGLLAGINFEINRLKHLKRWNIDYFNEVQTVDLSQDKQILFFRIFQELINNIIKHSQAESIMVEFEERETTYFLQIIDDGNAFDFYAKVNNAGFKNGAGLKGILNKTQLLKATLDINPNRKKGMIYTLNVPI